MKLSDDQIKSLNLKDGQKITFMTTSSMGAFSRYEVTVCVVNNRPAYKLKGKRKKFYLPCDTDTFFFDGWNIPLRTESEKDPSSKSIVTNYMMDFNFNFKGDADEIRQYIENHNFNKHFSDENKERVYTVHDNTVNDAERVQVFKGLET